jgi:hypothetical protein
MPGRGPYTLTFGVGEIVPLKGPQRISLGLIHGYEVERAGDVWQVRTTGYSYEILLPDQYSLIGWHWHPRGRSTVTWPHVHIPRHTRPVDLSKAHVPTGLISLQSVLRFAIEEVGAEPLRPDWRVVLAETELLSQS